MRIRVGNGFGKGESDMEQNYLVRAAKYLADLRKRKAWRKVVSGLGTVVVFCTVYALILPAVTWARQPDCGQEEHVHDGSGNASRRARPTRTSCSTATRTSASWRAAG